MPTFAFQAAPQHLTVLLLRRLNAPLPVVSLQIHSFGNMLDARLLSMHNRSTSELLRTL
jgi:hypothetical protein